MKIKVVVGFFTICAAVWLTMPSRLGAEASTDASYAAQIQMKPVFSTPLECLGEQAPPAGESQALLSAIQAFDGNNVKAGFAALENFLAMHPDSVWAPSLHFNLAERLSSQGRHSLALVHWAAAWNVVKADKMHKGQAMAARVFSKWTASLLGLGQTEKLAALFKELDTLQLPLGSFGGQVNETRVYFTRMTARPETFFRCGSFALVQFADVLHIDLQARRQILLEEAPKLGFSLSELANLANSNGLPVSVVRRPAGAAIPVPCVAHWKSGHYVAITEKNGNNFRVMDSAVKGGLTMDQEAIEAESSGAFLLARDKVPTAWKQINQIEGATICGRGGPNDIIDDDDNGENPCPPGDVDNQDANCDPPAANDGAADGGGDDNPCCDGMAIWRVSEPYINLWVEDAPLFYRLSNGKIMRLKLAYKQRGTDKTTYGHQVGGFGPNWECNLIGMLETSSPGSLPAIFLNHMAGGGIRQIASASDGSGGTVDYKSGGQCSVDSGSASLEGGTSGSFSVPVITSPTGSQNRYAYAATPITGGNTYNFLTRRVDRYGRYTQYNYQTVGNVVQLTNIVDQDGRNIRLAYTNVSRPYLITSAADPYNRTNYFYYDNSDRLTNIVDMSGLSSSFQYDSAGVITNLHTGYGDTGFQYLLCNDGSPSQNLCRFLLVTEASQNHQLYAYRDCFTTQSSPDGDSGIWGHSGFSISESFSIYRNSFHWNRKQYDVVKANNSNALPNDSLQLNGYSSGILKLTTADYLNAEMNHWRHGYLPAINPGHSTVSDTLDAQAGPVVYSNPGDRVGGIGYDYMSSLKRAVSVYYDATLSLSITRSDLGRPLITTYKNSDGSSANYTNTYDANGRYLKLEKGPRGEIIRGYGYNNPNFPNLLTSVTNAVGDVIRYTHDAASPATITTFPTIRVTSITFPGGLVRTNVYYASGPSQGFLQMQADLGIRTNYFTYANGNLALQTNELGLVTTNIWDGLNRLISTGYPDTTTISNLYDNVHNKLDLIGTKDRLNQWAYYGYNNVRQLEWETNVNGQITHYAYCSCGSPESIKQWLDEREIATHLDYDIAGRLTDVRYPDPADPAIPSVPYKVTRTYDDNNELQTISDTGGRTLKLTYAQHGTKFNLSSASMVSGASAFLLLTNTYDEYGRVTNCTDRNAVTATNGYDFIGRLVARQFFGYSGDKKSGIEKFVYDSRGLSNYFDPLQHLTTYVRDAASRVLFETNANKEVLRFTYNYASELASLTDGKNQKTSWIYDIYGCVTSKMDERGDEMFHYTYDSNDRLITRLQASSVMTTYKYDPIGNLTNVVYPGSVMANIYQYDNLNRLTNMVDAIGATAFTWTDGDQLAAEVGPWANDAVSHTYLNRLRATLGLLQPGGGSAWSESYQYDEFMRLKQVVSPAGTFGYEYASLQTPAGVNTASDLLQKLTFPNSSTSLRHYDDLGRLEFTKLTDATGTSVYDNHAYEYDLGSQRTKQTFADGNYQNYTYDSIGQLKTAQGYETGGSARAHEQFGYAYDAAWNLNQRTNGVLVQTFAVNPVNELTAASRPANATITVAGAYENGTPPVSVAVSGTGLTTGPATVYADKTWVKTGATPANGVSTYTATATDSAGKVSQDTVTVNLPVNVSYQYDARGNLTSDGRRVFAFDDENQLTSVSVANAWRTEFAYDGLLRRRIMREFVWQGFTWVQTNEVHYVYDGYLPIQERDGNNVPRVTYTRGNDLSGNLQDAGGIGGLLARTDMTYNSPLASAYYQADGNGNVTCLIDYNNAVKARYSYDPYGNMLALSGPLADANTYRFSSKEWNANAGLYYYLYRFYDSNLQRWINRDPIQELGGINLFVFCDGDSVNFFDSFGLTDSSIDACARNPGALREEAREALKDGEEFMKNAEAKMAREKAANQFAKNALDNFKGRVKNIMDHLDKRHLDAARKELQGKVVKLKPDGTPYDHVTEVREAQQGLSKVIQSIKNLRSKTPDGNMAKALDKTLSELSDFLDKTKGWCPSK